MIIRFGLGYAPDSWNALRDHLQKKGYSWEEMLDAALVVKGRNDSVYDAFRGRVIFPIIDLRGNVIGFGGRVIGSDRGPKYLNSSDTLAYKKSRNLFAMNFAKNAGRQAANPLRGVHGYGVDAPGQGLTTPLPPWVRRSPRSRPGSSPTTPTR